MSDDLLTVSSLKTHIHTYRGVVKAVDGISFTVGRGEAVGIVGESGSGKSMTALSIMRFVPPGARFEDGTILFDGDNLLDLPIEAMRKIRGCRIAMVFQDPMTYLNPLKKVGDQIAEVLIKHGNMSRRDARPKTIAALRSVRLASPEEVVGQYPHQLSGGMRQRVLIAMAIACHPSFLIADEPTTALDVTVQAQIIDLIKDIRAEMGLPLLLITHDLGIVAHLCDRVYVMYAGKIMEEADVATLFHGPRHPYTAGLMESIQYAERPGAAVSYIEGSVPDLRDPPRGCRFHPRCRRVMDICREQQPERFAISETQAAFCWLYK